MMSSAGWGVFNNTTVRNYFDVARFDKERMLIYNTTSGADFYLIMGGSLQKTLNLYTLITGRAYVLPRWMYGLSFGGHMQENQFEISAPGLPFFLRIRGDFPSSRFAVSFRENMYLSPEIFVEIRLPPGGKFHWQRSYEFLRCDGT